MLNTYDFTREARHMSYRPIRAIAPSFVKSYRYRIYTENVHIRAIYKLCDSVLSGYTIALTRGVWEKTHEASLYIEFIGTESDAKIRKLAESIKVRNNQSAVLVTRESIESVLL